MTGSAVTMMIAVCGLVWGGFAGFLVFIMRKERRSRREPVEPELP